MENTLKSRFEAERRKHKLPSFEILDKEFSISEIEDTEDVVRAIREKIADKINNTRDLLEGILAPDTNITSLYESRIFDEQQKKAIFEVYRILMSMSRRSDALYILNDDAMDAKYINECHEKWQAIKPQLLKMVNALEDSWKTEDKPTDRLAYFG